MAWLAVDKDGSEYIYSAKPERVIRYGYWWKRRGLGGNIGDVVELPEGSIKKLIGCNLTWEDEPVEILEED